MAEQKTIPELQKELEEIEKLIELQKPISFRQSKRILRAGFLGNIIAKSLSGQPLGEAIRFGVSDEMKALAMKFKEATHPLGMARALSGGNPVGPLIVGKILNSDIRDIEYFSGMRLRHRKTDDEEIEEDSNPLFLQKQQTKITNVKMNESVANAMGQLYLIYKKTYEQEKRIDQLNKLFAEEKKQEDDKRHAETMATLQELKKKTENIRIPTVEQPKEIPSDFVSKIPGRTSPSRKRPLTKSRLKTFFRKNKTKLAVAATAAATGVATNILTRTYTASEVNNVESKEIYEYLTKVKGLEHNNAVGILANIQAESSFNSAAIGDNGTSGGLFQHHAERFSALQKAVPDWQKNWKGQVDFALSEKEASGYSNIKFQNSQLAADYWVKNFEKPRDMFGESQKRMAYSVAFDQLLNVGASITPATSVSTGQQISQMTADNSTLKKEMQQKKSVVVVNNNNTVLNKLPNKSYSVEVQKTEIEKSNEAQLMWLQRGYS